MKNQVPSAVKKERSKALMERGRWVAESFFQRNIGKETQVLFEVEEGDYLTGYTDNYIKAYLPLIKGISCLNELLEVRMVSLYGDGVIVDV